MGWRIPLTDIAADAAEAGPALEDAVLAVLRSGEYVLGPETHAFEDEMACLTGVRFAVGVGSGIQKSPDDSRDFFRSRQYRLVGRRGIETMISALRGRGGTSYPIVL